MRHHDQQSSILYNCMLLRHLRPISIHLNSIEYSSEDKFKDTEVLTWKNDKIILKITKTFKKFSVFWVVY